MCGHDLHTSCLVGTACLLAQGKQTWSGTLMIVAQPGEETMQGAKAMLDDGLFTRFPKPDVALAQHTMFFPAGTIGYHPGCTLAAEHNVRIRLFGVGTHGSMPQKSIDPVVMASALVMRLHCRLAVFSWPCLSNLLLESLVFRPGFHIGKATYSCCLKIGRAVVRRSEPCDAIAWKSPECSLWFLLKEDTPFVEHDPGNTTAETCVACVKSRQ